MATLPERPDLAQLKRQARELQRAVRAGDHPAAGGVGGEGPDFPLTKAQLALARRYGFASWTRLRRHVDTIAARSWTFVEPDDEVGRFVADACLSYAVDGPDRLARAEATRAQQPSLVLQSLAAAVVCADVSAVRGFLRRDRAAAAAPTGPHGWSPLMYLAYARLDAGREDVLTVARMLLDAGADPNDGRFFGGLATPFTVLTGVLGGGEQDQPPHPQAAAFARLLLERGAEANDAQALYNRQFGEDDSALELLLEFGLGHGDGGPWRRALPDLLVPPARLVRRLLRWAVVHDQRERVTLLAAHGVDVCSPLGSRTPLELALHNGHIELADQLRAAGADEPVLVADDAFVAAALAGDRVRVAGAPADVVARVIAQRPGLLVWAAAQGRIAAVEVLLDAGFDIDALGRGDVPRDEPWQTALHSAVEHDDADTVRLLLDRGADRTIRDARFDSTPLQWAGHLGRDDLADLLRG